MGTPFFGARDTKKGALIFWRTVKNTALVPKCVLIRSSSPLHGAILVDVEVAALPDDLNWWFARGQEALEIQEEVRGRNRSHDDDMTNKMSTEALALLIWAQSYNLGVSRSRDVHCLRSLVCSNPLNKSQ